MGGIETWLMYLLRRADRREVAMDFLSKRRRETVYDREARERGAVLYPMPSTSDRRAWAAELARILREAGPYDVVHVHRRHAELPLRVACAAGVPVRVVHSHNAVPPRGVARLPGAGLRRRLARRHATLGLACSGPAAEAAFGPNWRRDARLRVLPYGIDFEPFSAAVDRAALRRELGVPADARLVVHVGRLHPQKNHAFLLEVFAGLRRELPGAHLLLVGDGELRGELERRVAALGLAGAVTLAGIRRDVARVLRAADTFAFPSRWEGLGIAVVEAQAAGLPVVCSEAVPEESRVVPELVTRLALGDPTPWVRALRRALLAGGAVPAERALERVRASDFEAGRGLAALLSLYREGLCREGLRGGPPRARPGGGW